MSFEDLQSENVLTVPDTYLYSDDRAPGINAGADGMAVCYLGYHERKEQVVLEVDVKRNFGVIHYNNLQWRHPLYIRRRTIHAPKEWGGDWCLKPAVFYWLSACWLALVGETLDKPKCVSDWEESSEHMEGLECLTVNDGYGRARRGHDKQPKGVSR